MGSLVALLQPGQELPADLLKAVLAVLLGLAHDQASCDAVQQANGLPKIIKLLEYAGDEQVRVCVGCQDYKSSRTVNCLVLGPIPRSSPKSCIAFHLICDLYMLKRAVLYDSASIVVFPSACLALHPQP